MKTSFTLTIALALSVFTVKIFAQAGSLDFSFNGTGKVISDFQTHRDGYANAMVRQSDGKIIAAGNYVVNNVAALVRYNSDGTIDKNFGISGQVITRFSANIQAVVALQADGKIMMAGYSKLALENGRTLKDFSMGRLNANGTVDKTFGREGNDVLLGDEGEFRSVKIQADNKIVMAGSDNNSRTLYRCNQNGNGEKSFGNQ